MKDFLRDENGEFRVENGNLVVGESTMQHQQDIIYAEKGWWHFDPTVGVGLMQWLNESGTAPGLVREMRTELEKDGMNVKTIGITQDGINIDATYPSSETN